MFYIFLVFYTYPATKKERKIRKNVIEHSHSNKARRE